MEIESRPLAEIKPYENNPRINDAAVDAVAESIRRFGFRQPIVVDEAGVIVCGHTRWKAAQKLGLTEVPVHVARDLTPGQIRAYRVADNKVSERSKWNRQLLINELVGLDGFNLTDLGFSLDEIDRLLGSEAHDERGTAPTLGDLKYQVVVECGNEVLQRRVIEICEREGFECKAVIL
jgi:ParB-like chromosome segregation protein Spo0J